MSIYGTILWFDNSDDEDGPAPIIYRGSHVMPSDNDERGGSFDLGAIPGFVSRPGRPALDEYGDRRHPWLRVSINDETVVLDRAQVATLADKLRRWLESSKEIGTDDGSPDASTEPTYYLAADVENRFREYVRGVVVGGMDERIGLAWRLFENVLTAFPASAVPNVDPLAHVKVGDPDPTAKRVGGVDCDAEDVAGLCTREVDHPGHHIAGDGEAVVRVWRDDA